MDPELKDYLDAWFARRERDFDNLMVLMGALPSPADHNNSTPAITTDGVVGPVQAGSAMTELVTAAVVATDVSSSTAKAPEVLQVVLDASPDYIEMARVTCSTECSHQVATTDIVNEVREATAAIFLEPAVDLSNNEVEQPAHPTPSIGIVEQAVVLFHGIHHVYFADDFGHVWWPPDHHPRTSSVLQEWPYLKLQLPVPWSQQGLFQATVPIDEKSAGIAPAVPKVPVHRPMPWPYFVGVHADGDGTRPLPWPSFREVSVNKVFSEMLSADEHQLSAILTAEHSIQAVPLQLSMAYSEWRIPLSGSAIMCVLAVSLKDGNALAYLNLHAVCIELVGKHEQPNYIAVDSCEAGMMPFDTSFTAMCSFRLQSVVFSGDGKRWSYWWFLSCIFEAYNYWGVQCHELGASMSVHQESIGCSYWYLHFGAVKSFWTLVCGAWEIDKRSNSESSSKPLDSVLMCSHETVRMWDQQLSTCLLNYDVQISTSWVKSSYSDSLNEFLVQCYVASSALSLDPLFERELGVIVSSVPAVFTSQEASPGLKMQSHDSRFHAWAGTLGWHRGLLNLIVFYQTFSDIAHGSPWYFSMQLQRIWDPGIGLTPSAYTQLIVLSSTYAPQWQLSEHCFTSQYILDTCGQIYLLIPDSTHWKYAVFCTWLDGRFGLSLYNWYQSAIKFHSGSARNTVLDVSWGLGYFLLAYVGCTTMTWVQEGFQGGRRTPALGRHKELRSPGDPGDAATGDQINGRIQQWDPGGYSAASAWGQAEFQGGRDVSAPLAPLSPAASGGLSGPIPLLLEAQVLE